MFNCNISTLSLFIVAYQIIITKYSLCRSVLEVAISYNIVNIRRSLWIPVLRQTNSCKYENFEHLVSYQTNKQKCWTIYLLLPLSVHSPDMPQALKWGYHGIAHGKIRGWGYFLPKTSAQETAWQFTPEKLLQQKWRCLMTPCQLLVNAFSLTKSSSLLKSHLRADNILIRILLVKGVGKSLAGPKSKFCTHCCCQTCTF